MEPVTVDFVLMNYRDVIQVELGQMTADQIRQVPLRGVVDENSSRLVLPEAAARELGLPAAGSAIVRHSDGTREECGLAKDAYVRLLGRESTFTAVVEPGRSEAVLGALVLDELDLLVDRRTSELRPRSPRGIVADVERPIIEVVEPARRSVVRLLLSTVLSRFGERLRKAPAWRLAVLSAALLAGCVLLYFYAFAPRTEDLAPFSRGENPVIDSWFLYSPARLYHLVSDTWKDWQRNYYVEVQLFADMAFPLLYASLLAVLQVWWSRGLLPWRAPYLWLLLLPLIGMLADYLENLFIILAIERHAGRPELIAWAASLFTSVKWVFDALAVISVLLLGLLQGVRLVRLAFARKSQPASPATERIA